MRRAMFWRALVVAVTVTTGGAVAAAGTTAAGASQRAAVTPAGHRAAPRAHPGSPVPARPAGKGRMCVTGPVSCAQVAGPAVTSLGGISGGDQPAVLYYSSHNGAGNRNRWQLSLPRDPSPTRITGRSWGFQLASSFWLGMALCDTQSYPLQVSTCTPDSDTNITTSLARHPGTAQLQLQFYPPGFAEWPAGNSCDPTRWCAAVNIFSLSEDPVNGTVNNPTCTAQAGIEYLNFAFVTTSGTPIGPPGPVDATVATLSPQNTDTLFMYPGDRVQVTMHNTAAGVQVMLSDQTTRQTGTMTASAANGFGQIQYDPAGTSCNQVPYDFHPMYGTSSPRTRVPWAAHSGNITAAADIGQFDACSGPNPVTAGGDCPSGNTEGAGSDEEPTDADDSNCFDAAVSSLVPVNGCLSGNRGFDGPSYQRDWPNGNTSLHPAPALFSSPATGTRYNVSYPRTAIEADTPRVESNSGTCNQSSGTGCTLLPVTDDGQPATFYPFFSITSRTRSGGCRWFLGDNVPGLTASDFGGIFQYGSLLPQQYLTPGGGGATETLFNDFQQAFTHNPCPV